MLIATEKSVYELDVNAEPVDPQWIFGEVEITATAEKGTIRMAALSKAHLVLWRDESGPVTVQTGIDERITAIQITCTDPPIAVLGTEPPRIYRWNSAKNQIYRIPSFDQLECRRDWFTPWGGPPAVRSLAQGDTSAVYADIHVGSIMRSFDSGCDWEPVTPELHKDVHQVATSPAGPSRVYANTADAVWISEDRGDRWQHRPFPHDVTYGRAVAVHPTDPDCILASVSKGPHGEDVLGRLFRSDDCGINWTHVQEGFPSYTRANINTFHITFDSTGTCWAAVREKLYRSTDRGRSWQEVWRSPCEIQTMNAETH